MVLGIHIHGALEGQAKVPGHRNYSVSVELGKEPAESRHDVWVELEMVPSDYTRDSGLDEIEEFLWGCS